MPSSATSWPAADTLPVMAICTVPAAVVFVAAWAKGRTAHASRTGSRRMCARVLPSSDGLAGYRMAQSSSAPPACAFTFWAAASATRWEK